MLRAKCKRAQVQGSGSVILLRPKIGLATQKMTSLACQDNNIPIQNTYQ